VATQTTNTTKTTKQVAVSFVSGTRPQTSGLADRLEEIVESWARSQYELVTLAAEFADSPGWMLTGSPTAAHWLAIIADVEPCTAREWIRIGRMLQALPAIADAFQARQVSYSKVRTLTRLATPENELELLDIATTTTAADLGKALAAWLLRNREPEDVEAHQHRQRSVKWRTEHDGMVTFTLRLPPWIAAVLISFLTTWVMRTKPNPDAEGAWPTVAQQHAEAVHDLLCNGSGRVDAEVVVHVNSEGNTLEDGTPLADSVVAKLIPQAFISALIHDAKQHPIDATNRRRHPNRRQKRLVKARDNNCVDCGRADLLQYDHVPAYGLTEHTITSELRLRCAPCHHARHEQESSAG